MVPIESGDDPAGEIGEDVKGIASGSEGFGEPGNHHLKDNRKDRPILEDLAGTRVAVMGADPKQALGVKDHGNKERQAKHIIEVVVRKQAADVMGF